MIHTAVPSTPSRSLRCALPYLRRHRRRVTNLLHFTVHSSPQQQQQPACASVCYFMDTCTCREVRRHGYNVFAGLYGPIASFCCLHSMRLFGSILCNIVQFLSGFYVSVKTLKKLKKKRLQMRFSYLNAKERNRLLLRLCWSPRYSTCVRLPTCR